MSSASPEANKLPQAHCNMEVSLSPTTNSPSLAGQPHEYSGSCPLCNWKAPHDRPQATEYKHIDNDE